MAEGKKSFVLYSSYLSVVEKLPDDKAGLLFKTILRYVNDRNPEVKDLMVDLTFEPIKLQLKRDLKSYEATIERKSAGGKKGMEARWGKKEKPESKQESTIDGKVVLPVSKDNKGENTIDIWIKDLANSSHIERIAMDLGQKKELLIAKIPEFKKACQIEYPTHEKFLFHFKNWARKQKENEVITPVKKRNTL